jgi:malate dehydrogenase (oxaloacetate-decarboxylating)
MAAVHATGIPLSQHTFAMFGTGSAGIGIVDLLIAFMKEEGLSEEQARDRFYAFNRRGLIVEGGMGIRSDQLPLARKKSDVESWKLSDDSAITLLDVVRNAKVTVLVGASAQPGAFTEEIVREMASHTPRPVIFPLSNPTALAEATPADVLRWTEGRALVGTGSPFAPVEVNGKLVRISQINNSFIFPGLALGILVSKALRVTDGMIMAAARTLAKLSPASEDSEAPLLPPIADSRKISLIVAEAVGKQAIAEGIAAIEEPSTLKEQLLAYVWEPVYLPYEKIPSNTD